MTYSDNVLYFFLKLHHLTIIFDIPIRTGFARSFHPRGGRGIDNTTEIYITT